MLQWLLWGACGLSLAAALAAIALPIGGSVNRIGGVAIPFAVAAASLAALALILALERWASLVLYALSALAITYGLMSLGSLPLRLAVLGTCPAASSTCPPGFEPPMTAGENLAVEAGITLGILGLLLVMAALELRYQPRLRLFGRAPRAQRPEAEAPEPPPEMKASAIVKKPAASTAPKMGSEGDPAD
jgi:hypothetical protein